MAVAVNTPKSLSNLFVPPQADVCQRCLQRVYLVERVGPVNGVIFHRQCFKCAKCEQHLTMRTYYTNQIELGDKEIYCRGHTPKTALHGFDARAMSMQNALRAPSTTGQFNAMIQPTGHTPSIGQDAAYIQHPVAAQNQFQRKYKQKYERHHYPAFVVNTKERLYEAQKELEESQRVEEDRLMSVFQAARMEESGKMQAEIDREWESRLAELTAQFDQTMERKTKKGKNSDDSKAATQRYKQKKDELEKNMTIKMKNKKEAITLRLRQKEQMDTSVLVQKHSEQMMSLVKEKQDEIRQQLEAEMMQGDGSQEEAVEEALAAMTLPEEIPDPHAPNCRKRDLYYDPTVFKELDEYVFSVAEQDQATFTDLVRELTQHCLTDLQKARAIFRWITVKDLNVLEFSATLEEDTPMGLLRGIKHGTETYHTLFMRLCSYAGVPCVEVKGHSKSVGYEPGMKIREGFFQNTWNAVLIDKNWWPVQCNWGARHLVLNKDVQVKKTTPPRKQDKIRYQYDEHYFLTDPDEFIREFWAQDPDWQLLVAPVTLEQFEQMPFVRSVFFHYGLEFSQSMKAVLHTHSKGGAEVKLSVPVEYSHDLVFHYQIRFADRERTAETEYRGAKLERFVFHSLVDAEALFSVHVPAPGSYFLEVFANKIDDSNKIGADPNAPMQPFRLKCACKFKIVCEELVGKMHPLPNCASGEWGPSKGQRHFGIMPLTHVTGVVNVDNTTELRFQIPRPLHFLTKLRMNHVEDSQLEKFVSHTATSDMLIVRVQPPQTGQFGLDIYARPVDASDNHTLAHACKYLLNVTRVDTVVDMPEARGDTIGATRNDKWGPTPGFVQLGLSTLSHDNGTIQKTDDSSLTIEMGISEPIKLSFHLTREPDEDCRDRVSLKENSKRVKFALRLAKPGSYVFAIYARKKKETSMLNVYNYMIKYEPPEKDSTLKKKNKGIFKK